MSIELISKIIIQKDNKIFYLFLAPKNIREAQRIVPDRIRKHYGHEFLPK